MKKYIKNSKCYRNKTLFIHDLNPFILFIIVSTLLISCVIDKPLLNLDPISSGFYNKAEIIMMKQEKKTFLSLQDENSRKLFIGEFWVKRDPTPGTPENEYKDEFYKRVEFTKKYFREIGMDGWKTDRGRIFALLGPPDNRNIQPFAQSYIDQDTLEVEKVEAWEVWIYYDYDLILEFEDKSGLGKYLLKNPPVELIAAIERENYYMMSEKMVKERNVLKNLELEYLIETKKIIVKAPLNLIVLKEENNKLKSKIGFIISFFKKEKKEGLKFQRDVDFEVDKDEALKLDHFDFSFEFNVPAGEYIVELLIIELQKKDKQNRHRKIFEIEIK